MQHCSKYLILIRNPGIRKIAALLMLVVFAISITPTIVFHNLFAGHTDSVNKDWDAGSTEIGVPLFNCHCDHLVAESPFTDPLPVIEIHTTSLYAQYSETRQPPLHTAADHTYPLRGPPAV